MYIDTKTSEFKININEILISSLFILFIPIFKIGSFGNLLTLSIISTSLFLSKKITPLLGIFFLCLILSFRIPYINNEFDIVNIIPFLGFFFSGESRNFCTKIKFINLRSNSILKRFIDIFVSNLPTFSLWPTIIFYSFIDFKVSGLPSHNILSVLLCYLSIFYAYTGKFKKSQRLFIVITALLIFFLTGNRSAILFLLIIPINNVIYYFFLLPLIITLYLTVFLSVEIPLQPFQQGGIFFKWPDPLRLVYSDIFFNSSFDYFGMKSNNDLLATTRSGAVDFHNSFMTVIARDGIVGVLKIILFSLSGLLMPFKLFITLILRASCDTFLLGSIYDLFLFGYLGTLFKRLKFKK